MTVIRASSSNIRYVIQGGKEAYIVLTGEDQNTVMVLDTDGIERDVIETALENWFGDWFDKSKIVWNQQ